jgi:hypothetical protein
MNDVITWPEIAALASIAGAAATAWKIRATDKRHYDGKLETYAKDLADFKLYVATIHPTMKELAAIEERLTLALNRLADRLDRLLDK